MSGVGTPEALVGVSVAMRQLRALIARVAGTTLPVLIQGETGSGKELVARALHGASGRSGPLTALNICAVPEPMFEATLFGHVRGAFTGAVASSAGYLSEANHGTLFLDEISGLPLQAQAKLLRAVELKEFRPVGAGVDRRSDFRLVAATNEDLQEAARTGSFRLDLLQRLSGIRIVIPPLRSRREDIAPLAEHFLRGHRCDANRALTQLEPAALAVLEAYEWPGNIRQLRLVLECACALVDSSIGRGDILPLLSGPTTAIAPISQPQQRRLIEALMRAEWDVDRAAAELGVHRATVYRRLKRLGISQELAQHHDAGAIRTVHVAARVETPRAASR
jgi:DNA-binding NtrC family response regulator